MAFYQRRRFGGRGGAERVIRSSPTTWRSESTNWITTTSDSSLALARSLCPPEKSFNGFTQLIFRLEA